LLFTLPHAPPSPLFPYTTLFRSRLGVTRFPIGRDELGNLPLGRWGVVLAVRRGRVSVHLIPQCGKVRYGTVRLWLWFGAMIGDLDRKSTRLNSSHVKISYAVFCL